MARNIRNISITSYEVSFFNAKTKAIMIATVSSNSDSKVIKQLCKMFDLKPAQVAVTEIAERKATYKITDVNALVAYGLESGLMILADDDETDDDEDDETEDDDDD